MSARSGRAILRFDLATQFMIRSIAASGIVALLLASSARAGAEARLAEYVSRVWQTENGLPQNAVQAIVQTRDGYLWLGTPAGLVRFDGVRFTVFNWGEPPRNNVHALLEDHDGRLWIGTYGGGLYRYDAGRFEDFTSGLGPRSDLVRTLYEDRHGMLWVGTDEGGVSHGRPGRFRRHTVAAGLSNDTVRVVFEDRDGRIWIGTNAGGLNLWDGKHLTAFAIKPGPLSRYTKRDAISNDNVLALWQDADGVLWIGTDGGGLWRMRGDRIDPLPAHDALRIKGVRRLLQDSEGDLWVGTDGGGLARRRSGKFLALTSREGLPSDIVLSLLEDRERNLWVGTRDGLLQLKRRKFSVYGTSDGLANDFITALFGGRDGDLWVGTRAGLDRLANGRARRLPAGAGVPNDTVAALLEDRADNVWIGTRDGLARLHDGRTTILTTSAGLPSNFVTSVAERRSGGIWVGTRGGLVHVQDGAVRSVPGAPDRITAIQEAADETLWVGTMGKGLGRLQRQQWRFWTTAEGLTHDTVTSIYESGPDIWVTTPAGLNRLRDATLHSYTGRQGLPSTQLFAALDDGRGFLWLSSVSGVARVEKQSMDDLDAGKTGSLNATSYGTSDGMRSSECNGEVQPAAWRTKDGRLWFPTLKGLAVIDPAHVPSNPRPPPVLIEEVRVDGEALPPEAKAAALAPGHKRFEFRYTALSFFAPAKVRFRYKLEGFDTDWVTAGTRRVAYYTNIPAGRYRFHVMAANEDGVWNTTGADYDFALRTHFYRTPVFWGISLAVAAAAGLLMHRLYLRRMKAEFAAVLAERGRIAREIHDTLAQGFVGIAVQLETVSKLQSVSAELARQHLDRARILVRSSLAEARRSVWALRAQALEKSDLAGALGEVAQQLSGPTEVAVNVSGPRRRLPVEVENNLLRIGQEAVTNAVRHARAQRVLVDLLYGDGRVRLSVRDDGRGFDVESTTHRAAPDHFGLAGIRERVQNLGGELSLFSRKGEGVELIVEVPVA